jgi:hypothetical protein
MNLEQLDREIESWRSKIAAAADNLLALDDNLTYKRLEGKDGLPVITLTGVTQKRVGPALAAMHELFKYMGLLTGVVDQATLMRKSVSRFRADSAIREIEELLTGQSITLPSDPTPLAKRSLLTVSQTTNTIAPERLLASMTESFEVARDAVFAVEAAWNKLEPALGRRESDLATLQRIADGAGMGGLPELAQARQVAQALRQQVETDPLGASADFDALLVPRLQQAQARLTEVANQRAQLAGDFSQARQILARIQETNARCEAALEDCRSKIGDVPTLRAPLDQARIAELADWLSTLEGALQQGRTQPARVGLDRWLATANEYLKVEQQACDANSAPVEQRAELNGRLAALKMKAKARGLASDSALQSAALEAETLLQQFPVRLDRIGQLVSTYEARLAACAKGS